jgi:adenylate cyclase class 2
MDNKEIEARFLEINKDDLITKLKKINAQDMGENLLEEVIFYDNKLEWIERRKYIRLRKSGDQIKLTYKHNLEQTIDSATEIEIEVNDFQKTKEILVNAGLSAYRNQQKKRHTFKYEDLTIDIDTWPRIPTYVEIEGPSESLIKDFATNKLGLDWSEVVFDDAKTIIEKRYSIPVGEMSWFTFDKFE